MTVIKLEKITKVYSTGHVEKVALLNVDLEIEEGDTVAVMGPSGCGKSTMLNILGCLDLPTKGKYIINDRDVSKLGDAALSKIRSKEIGFVFQSYNLLPRLSALANIKLALLYGGNKGGQAKGLEALRTVGIESLARNKPAEMSGGQQQRVGIARALVKNPTILLADEPTGNLDSRSSLEVMGILQRLNKERNLTMVIVTHEEGVARHLHRVVRLADGEVVSDERLEDRIDSTKYSEVSV